MVQGRMRFKAESAPAACRPPTHLRHYEACVYVCTCVEWVHGYVWL